MPTTSRWKCFLLSHLSKPASDRVLYRTIDRSPIRGILEIGVGNAQRSRRMIEVALRQHPPEEVKYTGIDLFELRSDGGGETLTLKDTYQWLRQTQVRVRLVPGDPFSALARSANDLPKHDLVVINFDQDEASMERAWYFLPRLLRPDAQIFLEARDAGKAHPTFEQLDLSALEARIVGPSGRRRAA